MECGSTPVASPSDDLTTPACRSIGLPSEDGRTSRAGTGAAVRRRPVRLRRDGRPSVSAVGAGGRVSGRAVGSAAGPRTLVPADAIRSAAHACGCPARGGDRSPTPADRCSGVDARAPERASGSGAAALRTSRSTAAGSAGAGSAPGDAGSAPGGTGRADARTACTAVRAGADLRAVGRRFGSPPDGRHRVRRSAADGARSDPTTRLPAAGTGTGSGPFGDHPGGSGLGPAAGRSPLFGEAEKLRCLELRGSRARPAGDHRGRPEDHLLDLPTVAAQMMSGAEGAPPLSVSAAGDPR